MEKSNLLKEKIRLTFLLLGFSLLQHKLVSQTLIDHENFDGSGNASV